MGVVEIVFDIIAHNCLFNALLLCSTSLNRFMSKSQTRRANADMISSSKISRRHYFNLKEDNVEQLFF